jgi:Protein of unknown function (DUF3626)
MSLTNAQISAIDFVKSKAKGSPYLGKSELTINFHPDRQTIDGIPILVAVLNDGVLKSQFETQTSNGSLSAKPNGARWLWESKAFGSHYDLVPSSERPKYGALNLGLRTYGGSPRFGSSYFLLKENVLRRTTFCYPDSWLEPKHFSTFEKISTLIELMSESSGDPLDRYIEAQIHGEILVERDIECLILDPSFKNSGIENLASKFPFPLKWHSGFQLNTEELLGKEDYRGKKYIEIAGAISKSGFIDPYLIGCALNKNGYDEQDLKKVWHYLACFGNRS